MTKENYLREKREFEIDNEIAKHELNEELNQLSPSEITFLKACL